MILNFVKLAFEELCYAKHHSTHLDFAIFNNLGKNPMIAIEVGGNEYHRKASKQDERDAMKNVILEKYEIPLVRFPAMGVEKEIN